VIASSDLVSCFTTSEKMKAAQRVSDEEFSGVFCDFETEDQSTVIKKKTSISEDGSINSDLVDMELSSKSFCSQSFSSYDKWLQYFYMFACWNVLFLIMVISYMLFFTAPKTIWDALLFIDVIYTYVMFLRSRTGYIVEGIEERNLMKIRENYNKSWALAFDIVSVVPVGIIAHFFPGSEETIYAIGRQKQYVRLHFVANYLSKF